MSGLLGKIASGVLVTSFVVIGAAVAHSESTGNADADARIATMKQLGGHMKAVAAVAKGEAEYSPALNKNAAGIKAIAAGMGDLFPVGSGGEKTRSKPEIWSSKADFNKAIEALQVASAGLEKAVATGDRGAIGQALGATGKTCGGCHKPFRKPKDH
jgi:cytochrome c556